MPLGRFEPGNSGPGACTLGGAFFPFDRTTLEALYPTHRSYLRAVRRSAAENVAQGLLLERDAREYVTEAARSAVGR